MIDADPAAPNLVVIDGLDECSSREGICRVIEWIRTNERFLLTSRPEHEIETIVRSGPHPKVWAFLSHRITIRQ